MNTLIYNLTRFLLQNASGIWRQNRFYRCLLFMLLLSWPSDAVVSSRSLSLEEPLIGAQVIIERGQSPEEIESLFALLQSHSMNICRIRMFESYLYDNNGNRDFSTFDIAFRAAERHGIKIFATLFPKVEFTNIGGFKFPDSEAHLASVSAYIRDVVTHFRQYESLAGWVLLNEIGSGKAPFDKPLTVQQFANWKKADTVHALTAQGQPVMQFQQERFLMDYNSWYLRWLKEEVRKHDRNSHLHVNTHAIFDTYGEYNFTQWRDILDSFGGSAHASWHFGNFDRSRYHYAMAINSEIIRSGAGTKPWLMTELQGGNNLWSGGIPMCPSPQELTQWMWTVIGSGAKGMIFWSLNARSAGIEAGEWALLNLLNQPSERMRAASEMAETVNRNADLFANATVVESGINILYTRESLWSERRAETPGVAYSGRLPGGSIRSAIGFYETFAQLGIQANVKCIDEFDFEAIDQKGNIIVLAHQIALPANYVKKLERFVASGGTLVVEGLTGFFNEWMQVQATSHFPLAGLLGGFLSDAPFRASQFDIRFNQPKIVLPAHLWEGTINPATATPLALNSRGEVVAVTNAVGSGKVVWIPSLVAIAAHEKNNYQPMARLLEQQLLPSLKPASPRFKRFSPGMLMHTLRTNEGYLVVLMNKHSKAQKTELVFPQATAFRELTKSDGQLLKGSSVFTLQPEETKVIEFRTTQLKTSRPAVLSIDTTGFYKLTPIAAEWMKAGVEGGIPDLRQESKLYKAKPGDDLQRLIDKASRKGGVVWLAKGEYPIRKSLFLRNGVVLRGESKTETRLLIQLRGHFWKVANQKRVGAVMMHGICRAGLENMTVLYNAVAFEPNDRNRFDASWEPDVFHQPERRDTTLFVEQIWIHQSRNCWVQDCRILWAGSDPVRITHSDHITCRRNFIDRCYNKNDGGMGYYNISNSRHVLVMNDTVRRIRHFAIQNASKFNVVLNNYLEVDINFHNGDSGWNLIMGNTVRIPQWHSWNPVARGVPDQHLPPGKGNFIINNRFLDKNGKLIYSLPGVLYVMNDSWVGELVKIINF